MLEAARTAEETRAAIQPENPPTLMALARIDALLGRKTPCARPGRPAKNGLPPPTPTPSVPLLTDLALVETWTGERDAALGHLAGLVRLPYGPSYGDLRLNPDWDALRGDPRFEALCRELAPKRPSPVCPDGPAWPIGEILPRGWTCLPRLVNLRGHA